MPESQPPSARADGAALDRNWYVDGYVTGKDEGYRRGYVDGHYAGGRNCAECEAELYAPSAGPASAAAVLAGLREEMQRELDNAYREPAAVGLHEAIARIEAAQQRLTGPGEVGQ